MALSRTPIAHGIAAKIKFIIVRSSITTGYRWDRLPACLVF